MINADCAYCLSSPPLSDLSPSAPHIPLLYYSPVSPALALRFPLTLFPAQEAVDSVGELLQSKQPKQVARVVGLGGSHFHIYT